MKKSVKRIAKILGSIIIVAVLVIIAMYKFFPIPWMTPAATGEISNTNIYAIRNGSGAVYLIKTENGYIALDAGTDLEKLEASLQEAKINPLDVHSLLLTHSDFDHVAGLSLFSQAQIYMNEDEIGLLNGTVKRTAFAGNSLPEEIDMNKIILLQDKKEIFLDGTKISHIKSPGHTIGSMSFLIDDEYLFIGDACKISKGTASVHPFTMNAETAQATIEELKSISKDCAIVLTAHYGFYNEIK
jgi:glyoxylase-like metal-dependent hydrolase (beta-lactamase superfamily II)